MSAVRPTIKGFRVADGTYNGGQSVLIYAVFDQNITIGAGTGIPELILSNGAIARYEAASNTTDALGNSLIAFRYNVFASDRPSSDLNVIALAENDISFTGANGLIANTTINAALQNNMSWNHAVIINPQNSSGGVVDTIKPKILAMMGASATYSDGDVVPITLHFDENVVVTAGSGGLPTLLLSNGQQATYKSGSGTQDLVFEYQIQKNDNPSIDLDVSDVALNGGTIRDAASNNADLTITRTGVAANSLADSVSIVVSPTGGALPTTSGDVIPPTIQDVSIPAGTYKVGDEVRIKVTLTEPVNVKVTLDANGQPQLPELALGVNNQNSALAGKAHYLSGNGTNVLEFAYTVGLQDALNPGMTFVQGFATALGPNMIQDAAGNPLDGNFQGVPIDIVAATQGGSTALVLDAKAPVLDSNSVNGGLEIADGTYRIGDTAQLTVTFDSPVTVDGSPLLRLSNGGSATYVSGAGSNILKFEYKVRSTDASDADLAIVGLDTTAGNILGEATRDPDSGILTGGHPAQMSLTATDIANFRAANAALVDTVVPHGALSIIDDTGAVLTSVRKNETAFVKVTFGEPVTLDPAALTTEGGVVTNLVAQDGGRTWIGRFKPNDNQTLPTNLITLDNARVQDLAGNAGSGESVSSQFAVDTVAPAARIQSQITDGGKSRLLTINFGEPVTDLPLSAITVTGGVKGTFTKISDSLYTLQIKVNTDVLSRADGGIQVTLPDGAVKDALGNPLEKQVFNKYLDENAPVVTSMSATDGLYRVGQDVYVNVRLSEAVTVDAALGSPFVVLNNGARATYVESTVGKIDAYSRGTGSTLLPDGSHGLTVADYASAGVINVTDGNLAAVNHFVLSAGAGKADTSAEIQGLVNLARKAIARIESWNTSTGLGSAPTVADYQAVGVSGVDNQHLPIINARILGLNAGGADSVPEIQAIVSAFLKIQTFGASPGAAPIPDLADYFAVGLTGVSSANLAAVNAQVERLSHSGQDVLSNLAGALRLASAAIAKIEAFNTPGANQGSLTLIPDDYAAAGVTGVDYNNLSDVNDRIASAFPGAFHSSPEIQGVVNAVAALARIEDFQALVGAAPDVPDYETAGVSGVSAANLAAVNAQVLDSSAAVITTIADVQQLVTQADDAIQRIEDYNNGAVTTLIPSDYAAAGIYGVDSNNLQDINALIRSQAPLGADSVLKIQSLVSFRLIQDFAQNGGSGLPLQYYLDAGIENITANSVDAVNQQLATFSGGSLPTPDVLQRVVSEAVIWGYQNLGSSQLTTQVPTLSDYAQAGIQGVTQDNLTAVNAMVRAAPAGNGGGSYAQVLQALVTSANQALATIEAYNNSDAHTPIVPLMTPQGLVLDTTGAIALYESVGVTGVSESNLQAVNALVWAQSAGGAATPEKIQALVVIADAALQKITDYSNGNGVAPEALTVSDYGMAGVSGVTADNLQEINARVLNLPNPAVLDDVSIQSLVDGFNAAIQKIESYNNGNGSTPQALTLTDYSDAGITGVSATNLDAINARILASSNGGADTMREIQTVVNLVNGVTSPAPVRAFENVLTFKYTVQPGDLSKDLDVRAIVHNGATIRDAANNDANLRVIPGTNNLAPVANVELDGVVAQIVGINARSDTYQGIAAQSAGDGSLNRIDIHVRFSEAVTVDTSPGKTGPILALSNGATATYSGGSGSIELTFTYTVKPGDNDSSDLDVLGLAENDGVIADAGGNPVSVTIRPGQNNLAPFSSVVVDAQAPKIEQVYVKEGHYKAGSLVDLVVVLDKIAGVVLQDGQLPTLALSNSGTAHYVADKSTPTQLVFEYTVQEGDSETDAAGLGVTGIDLHGASITGLAGGALNLGVVSNASAYTPLTLAQGNVSVDLTPPEVVSLWLGEPANGPDHAITALKAGETTALTVIFNEPVQGVNRGLFQAESGQLGRFSSGDGGTTWTATFTPTKNIEDASNLITFRSGTVTDLAGNLSSGQFETQSYSVDTKLPTVTIHSDTPSGSVADGIEPMRFTVAFSEPVTLTHQLLSVEGGTVYGNPLQISDREWQVLVAPDHGKGQVKLRVDAGVATDASGNASQAAQTLVQSYDADIPTIESIKATGGNFKPGDRINFAVLFSENVQLEQAVGGDPAFLQLNNGARAVYQSGSGRTLNFVYTVGASDPVLEGQPLNVVAFIENDLQLTDAVGHQADVTIDASNQIRQTLAIDTVGPRIERFDVPADGVFRAGQSLWITAHTSENVVVQSSNGAPTLQLSNGKTATYVSGSGTQNLLFKYVIGSGDDAADLAVTGLQLNNAAITDTVGNGLDTHLGQGVDLATNHNVAIDTIAARIASIQTTSIDAQTHQDVGGINHNGAYKAGQSVVITVQFDDTVNVDITHGQPFLTLNNGKTATYTQGSGSSTLSFRYTVGANDINTTDLKVLGLAENGAKILDGAGNPSLVRIDAAENLASDFDVLVDTQGPTLTVTDNMAGLDVGSPVTYTLRFSEKMASGSLSESELQGYLYDYPASGSGPLPTISSVVTGSLLWSDGGRTATFAVAPADQYLGNLMLDIPANSVTDLADNGLIGRMVSTQAIDTQTVNLQVTPVAGPFLATSSATVRVYDSNGAVLNNAATSLDSSGHVLVTIPPQGGIGYRGPVLIEVIDSGAGSDYVDEFTGLPQSLSDGSTPVSLRAFVDVDQPAAFPITVSPLTELAVSLAGVTSSGLSSIHPLTSDVVGHFNGGVAQIFGLSDDIARLPVVTTLDPAFNGNGGALAPSEQYGQALALLSALDSQNGGTVNTISLLAASIRPAQAGSSDAFAIDQSGVTLLKSGVDALDPSAFPALSFTTLTIASDRETFRFGETATVTFTFSQAPSGFVAGDIDVSGGTLGALSGPVVQNDGTVVYSAMFTPTSYVDSLSGAISVAGATYTDFAGNFGFAGNTVDFQGDTQAPLVSMTPSVISTVASGISANEATSGLDVTVSLTGTNAVAGDVVSLRIGTGTPLTHVLAPADITAGSYAFRVDNTSSGLITNAANHFVAYVTDAAGNVGPNSSALTVNYDALAPSAPTSAPSVIAAIASGISSNEGTSGLDVTVSLSGTNAVAGDTVSLRIGAGTPLNHVLTPADITAGSYAFRVDNTSSGLTANAPNNFVVYVTDVAGNLGPNSSTLSVNYDTVVPSASASAPSVIPAIASGLSAAEATSGLDVTVALSGTNAVAGDTVSLRIGTGTPLTHVLTDSEISAGSYVFRVDASSAGLTANAANTFVAYVTDMAGNVGPDSLNLSVHYDALAPAAPPAAPSVGAAASSGVSAAEATAGFPVTVSLNGSGAVAGDRVYLKIGTGTPMSHILTDADVTAGSYAFTVTGTSPGMTANAQNSLVAYLTDTAGNVGPNSSALQVTYDTLPPAVMTVTDTTVANVTNSPVTYSVTFGEAVVGALSVANFTSSNGAVTNVSRVDSTHYDVTVTPNAAVSSATLDLGLVGTGLTDAAGNPVAIASLTTLDAQGIDTVAPLIASAPMVVGAITSGISAGEATSGLDVTVSLAGTHAVAGDTVSLRIGTGTPLPHVLTDSEISAGSYAFRVNNTSSGLTANASNNFVAYVTDAAGNVGPNSSALSVNYDTVSPLAANAAPSVIAAVAAGLSAGEASTGFAVTVSLAGTGAAVGDTVSLKIGSGAPLSHELTSNDVNAGTYAFTVNTSSSGLTANASNSFVSYVTDASGNMGPHSSALTVAYDTLAPAVTGVTDNTSASVTNGAVTFNVTLDEAIVGTVGVGQFTSTNGTVTSVTRVDSTHYTVTVVSQPGVALGTLNLGIDGTGLSDAAGNPVAITNLTPLDPQGIDTLSPVVSIAADSQSSVLDQPAVITFAFSEAPQTLPVIQADTGILSGLTLVSGATYTATLTPAIGHAANETTLTIGGWTDAVGNAGSTSQVAGLAGGPFFGTDLTYAAYATDGHLLSTGQYLTDPVTGSSTIRIPSGYEDAYLLVVTDTNAAAADYLDEFTGARVSLSRDDAGYSLRALVSGNSPVGGVITVSPLTELAAQWAHVTPGQAFTSAALTYNTAVGDLFGITNPVTTAVIFTNTAGFQPTDGLSDSERYGGALAVLSAADAVTGSMRDTLEQLASGISGSPENGWQVSDQARSMLGDAKTALGALVPGVHFSSGVLADPVSSVLSGTETLSRWITSTHTTTAPTVEDYQSAGIEGVNAFNLAMANELVMADAGGQPSLDVAPQAPAILNAFDVIGHWASGSGQQVPDASTYVLAGLGKPTVMEVLGLNARLRHDGYATGDTLTKLKALLTETNQSLETIGNWTTGSISIRPTVADYLSAGVEGVSSTNLDAVNQALNLSGVNTPSSEFRSLAFSAAIIKIVGYANGKDLPPPSVEDYAAAGISGVNGYNLDVANRILPVVDSADAHVLRGLIQAAMVTHGPQLSAMERISRYAQNGKIPPCVEDYLDAGIQGVTEANLDTVNAQIRTIPDTTMASEFMTDSDAFGDVGSDDSARATMGDIFSAPPMLPSQPPAKELNAELGLSESTNQQIERAYQLLGGGDLSPVQTDARGLKPIGDPEIAMAKIVAFATSIVAPTDDVAIPSAEDFALAGIRGVNLRNLASVNDSLRGAYLDYQALGSTSDLQSVIDTSTLAQDIVQHNPDQFLSAEQHLMLQTAVEKFALAVSMDQQADYPTYAKEVGEGNVLTPDDINLMLGRSDVTAETMDTVIRHITGQNSMPHTDNRFYEMSQVIKADAFIEDIQPVSEISSQPELIVRLVDASAGDDLNIFVDGHLAYRQVLSNDDIGAGRITLSGEELFSQSVTELPPSTGLQFGSDIQAGVIHFDQPKPTVLSDPYLYAYG